MALPVTQELLRKYDRPGPRYTSYPTAVEFNAAFTPVRYREHLKAANAARDEPLSLYIHIPFCEERCTFCGCHVIITRHHDRAVSYLDYLAREIDLLAQALPDRRQVIQYHWGGGTPTYLTPAEIRQLMAKVKEHFTVADDAEVAIEVDPRVTSREHVDTLRELGFNRLSMGVQDFTPEVQSAINRHQTEAETRDLFAYCRAIGFSSINLDLIYGLPLQTPTTFRQNLAAVIELRPDRVACYSYAHVPWIRGHQKGIEIEQLPPPEVKLELMAAAIDAFHAAGYRQIGMDHFALPEDELAQAMARGTLGRNFMGYTTKVASDMVGIGVSAIGDVRGAFAQNQKKLSTYYEMLDRGEFPIQRGFELTFDDHLRRQVITELMCNFRLPKAEIARRFGIDFDGYFAPELDELAHGPEIAVTPLGQLFVRNVCMTFDAYLRRPKDEQPKFSRTV
jgi:oxygen-independent coproporphyrinogen-3 oxidase